MTAPDRPSGRANIEGAFTAIPEWSGNYIPFARAEHGKAIITDDTSFRLGKSNCARDYDYASRNLGVLTTSPNLAGILSRVFLKSWDSPRRESIMSAGAYAPREHGARKQPPTMPQQLCYNPAG